MNFKGVTGLRKMLFDGFVAVFPDIGKKYLFSSYLARYLSRRNNYNIIYNKFSLILFYHHSSLFVSFYSFLNYLNYQRLQFSTMPHPQLLYSIWFASPYGTFLNGIGGSRALNPRKSIRAVKYQKPQVSIYGYRYFQNNSQLFWAFPGHSILSNYCMVL